MMPTSPTSRPKASGHVTIAKRPGTTQTDEQLASETAYSPSVAITAIASYPLKLLIPDRVVSTNCSWIYPITYGGGLVPGDDIDLDVEVQGECCALVTTQESSKVYPCEEGCVTRQTTTHYVADDAFCCILPDPVVCFADADFCSNQKVHMTGSSNLVLLDWLVSGRVARGESWLFKRYQSRIDVHVDDQLVFRDAIDLRNSRFMDMRKAMANYQVVGLCFLLGDKVSNICQMLSEKYAKQRDIHGVHTKDVICGYSGVKYRVGERQITGGYLRIMATDSNQAYGVIRDVVNPLVPILGADPFRNKYS